MRVGSVRSRLTLAVAATVGALGVAAAIVAPKVVEDALVNDRLDAEVGARPASVFDAEPFAATVGDSALAALFAPQLSDLVAELDRAGALDQLRALRADHTVQIVPIEGVLSTVDPQGGVSVVVGGAPDGPTISGDLLQQLAYDLGGSSGFFDPLAAAFDDPAFLDNLSAELGIDVGLDNLTEADIAPWLQYALGEGGSGEVPDIIAKMFGDEAALADLLEAPATRTVDDYLFGVRRSDGADVIVAAPSDGIARSVSRVRRALWLATPAMLALAGLITWLLAGRALRPVRAITDQTALIRSETLHERVPVPRSNDEIAHLATVMNAMLDRIQREDDRRRQFVSDASHELRSPIAALRTQAEAALAATPSESERTLASGVAAEAERLGTVVDDLLSLARHDEEVTIAGQDVDLDDLILSEAQRPRRVPIDVTGVSAGRVHGRPDEFARVISHLFDNAARHATSEVRATLRTEADSRVTFTVEDDGPGIPVDQRERVLERFVRLDPARQRDAGGAGLGLAVVASVVRAAGGTISIGESASGGARITIVL